MLNNLIKLNNHIKTGKSSIKPNEIKIGKINGDYNKINNVKINKYPTLFLYRMNNKEPLEYKGDRTTEGMLMWLENVNKWYNLINKLKWLANLNLQYKRKLFMNGLKTIFIVPATLIIIPKYIVF